VLGTWLRAKNEKVESVDFHKRVCSCAHVPATAFVYCALVSLVGVLDYKFHGEIYNGCTYMCTCVCILKNALAMHGGCYVYPCGDG